MKEEDEEFLAGMVEQLDITIRKLVADEQELCQKLGEARVMELKEFWNQLMSVEEAAECKRTLDYWDKMLIHTWVHCQRAYQTRALVGKAYMKFNSKL